MKIIILAVICAFMVAGFGYTATPFQEETLKMFDKIKKGL